MNISPKRVWFDSATLWVELNDGRTVGAPIVWFPRLMAATEKDLSDFELSPYGIHWENLDEDISVEGLLMGKGDQTKRPEKAA